MKLSLDWLSDSITWKETDPLRIADALTLSTAEVEEITVQGRFLEHCCVGNIVSLRKHPKADRLSLAQVETDRGMKNVVCGGTNLREGMLVAFAHVGATVKWHGAETVTLEKAAIRGEESEGMICAAEELELQDRFPPRKEDGERPVIDLSDAGYKPGTALRSALGLTDTVLHVSNKAIPHRADLFSHVGFARECIAIGLAEWKKEPTFALPTFPKTTLPFRCIVEIKELVPRYCSCIIEIDDVGETPEWMKKRLEATGWRSINLPIDITNYVATEVGMPLHSFDADDIRGDVRFRVTQKGESITTLDGVARPLPEGAIVLSDDEGIFDLLGIMGGLRSSTKKTTRRIYLHSAIVSPVHIRRTIMATGHRTDAATVYEKGIPKVAAAQGFARALALFLELVPGARIASAMDSWGDDGESSAITLPLERVVSVIGAEISTKESTTILENLGCIVQSKGKTDDLTVTPPLFRQDLRTHWDLIEEIARVHGFMNIEDRMPPAALQIPKRDPRVPTLRKALQEDGFFELVPLSVLGPQLLAKSGMDPAAALRIEDPLGEEFSLVQPSTLPRLFEHAEKALRQVDDTLRTFHLSSVADTQGEHTELGLLVAATRETDLRADPFLQLKTGLLHALEQAGYAAHVSPENGALPYAHPGRTGRLTVQGKDCGRLFEVHPSIRDAFDLPFRAAAATIDLSLLLSLLPSERFAEPVALYPAVTYDVTLPWSHAKPVDSLLTAIGSSHPLLRSVAIADLYHQKTQPADQYNLTLRCTYRADDRTLTEEEVKVAHEAVTGIAQKS